MNLHDTECGLNHVGFAPHYAKEASFIREETIEPTQAPTYFPTPADEEEENGEISENSEFLKEMKELLDEFFPLWKHNIKSKSPTRNTKFLKNLVKTMDKNFPGWRRNSVEGNYFTEDLSDTLKTF